MLKYALECLCAITSMTFDILYLMSYACIGCGHTTRSINPVKKGMPLKCIVDTHYVDTYFGVLCDLYFLF